MHAIGLFENYGFSTVQNFDETVDIFLGKLSILQNGRAVSQRKSWNDFSEKRPICRLKLCLVKSCPPTVNL